MKSFNIGTNNYWYTASVILDDVPAPLYYLARITEFICDHIPSIPLPQIPIKLKDKDTYDWTDNNDGRTNLKEWYGDIQQLFHLYVCTPVHHLVWKHTKSISIDLPYDFLKERFPDEFRNMDVEYTDEEDIEFRMKTKKLADQAYNEFLSVFDKLNYEHKKSDPFMNRKGD